MIMPRGRLKNMLKKMEVGAKERVAKRQEVMGGKGWLKTWRGLLLFLVAAAVAAGAGWWITQRSGGAPAAVSGANAALAGASALTFPASQFDDGRARQYVYRSPEGREIRFFLIKSSDGVIRAAFDACDVCWPSNRGYVQDGDDLVCGNCGRRFPSVRINVEQGGCNPAPLRRTVENGRVVIQPADLRLGAGYFDFKR
jgi:uncharacterized membrane protein